MNTQLESMKADVIKALELEGLPPEKQEALVEKFGEALMKRLFLATIEKLGKEGTKEYEALIEREASAEEIDAFLEQRVPGYQVFVQEVAGEFAHELKENMKQVS